NLSADNMVDAFNQGIKNGNLEEAASIQNSIFDRIREKVVSPDLLDRMSIPRQLKFLRIFNKNSAFRFMTDIRQGLIVYDELKRLEQLDPMNREVKYNLVSVVLKLWRYNAMQTDPGQIKQKILDLEQYGVDDDLISRMLVNYNIITAEKAMHERDYKTKDQSVEFILNNYGRFDLSDFDYLSLAQFFSYYGNIQMSVDLLTDKARTIEIDEDLLFYYINLTLTDTALTQTSEYRTIMLNAYNLNRDRYCRLFDTFGTGGVTFQLLEDPYLRNSYCENCQDR
ncbi:MAG: hypothetical protein KJO25_00925, partial [Bacteroidia bacterium]|nr:hypothetical protein [Bacteroidia bacterium]